MAEISRITHRHEFEATWTVSDVFAKFTKIGKRICFLAELHPDISLYNSRKTRSVSPPRRQYVFWYPTRSRISRAIFCTFSSDGWKYNFLSAPEHVNVSHAPSATWRRRKRNDWLDSEICSLARVRTYTRIVFNISRTLVRVYYVQWNRYGVTRRWHSRWEFALNCVSRGNV